MSNKFKEDVLQNYLDGAINKYIYERLSKTTDDGLTDDLTSELVQHAKDASDFGVENDKDFAIYFFIDHFVDDILKDTFDINISPEQRVDLSRFIFSNRKNHELDDLTDYRLLTHQWLSDKIDKKAHPNISGKENREHYSDLDKWISTLKKIYSSIHDNKMDRTIAIDHFTAKWDLDEKYKFLNWMRYYEDGTTEKYQVKNAELLKESLLPSSWTNGPDSGMNLTTYRPNEKTPQEMKFEEAKQYKKQMLSRLNSLKRLLIRYNDILPSQNIEKIYDEILKLEKSLGTLNVYASLKDCVIRSANRIEKFGFPEGANLLKTADNGAEIVSSLPQPPSNQPDLTPGSSSSVNINAIIDRLEGVSKILKSRDTIRELASIDILLNEIGLASYFPEISYAQSKLIESFSYACNKVEDIVSKLRGSGSIEKKKPERPTATTTTTVAPPAEPIDTGGVTEKPVGEIQTELPKKSRP